MALPVVGSIDWKWLLIGILVDRFLLGYLIALVRSLSGKKAAG